MRTFTDIALLKMKLPPLAGPPKPKTRGETTHGCTFSGHLSDEAHVVRDDALCRAPRGICRVRPRGILADADGLFPGGFECAFRFPYTFSWSWESLDACFRDLEWLSFSQLLWVISQPEKLFTQEENHMAHVNALQRSIAAAASFWRERQVPFDCVLNLFE